MIPISLSLPQTYPLFEAVLLQTVDIAEVFVALDIYGAMPSTHTEAEIP